MGEIAMGPGLIGLVLAGTRIIHIHGSPVDTGTIHVHVHRNPVDVENVRVHRSMQTGV